MGDTEANRPAEASAIDWIARQLAVGVSGSAALVPGAGRRRYWRICLADGRTAVLMHARAEREEILPPALRGTDPATAFLEITRLLGAAGLPVPRILAADPGRRLLLLEDLGGTHLRDLTAPGRIERTAEAIDWLVRAHAIDPSGSLVWRRRFDREWIRFELATFRRQIGAAPGRDISALDDALDALSDWIAGLPRALSLRDYQSHNLMIDRAGRLRIIDYQDALLAPRELDLAALLWDSYVPLEAAQRETLLERYARRAGVAVDPGALAALVVQRKCKDLGRFLSLSEGGDARWEPFVEPARGAVLDGLGRLPAPLAGAGESLARALEAQP